MKHILIIDDDSAVRDVLREIVATFGYEAHEVDSAKDAVSMLSTRKIDLIFLDISMPEISGDQLLAFIRKRDSRHLWSLSLPTLTKRLKSGCENRVLTRSSKSPSRSRM